MMRVYWSLDRSSSRQISLSFCAYELNPCYYALVLALSLLYLLSRDRDNEREVGLSSRRYVEGMSEYVPVLSKDSQHSKSNLLNPREAKWVHKTTARCAG
eukprot:scaffold5994_cov150-Skeletonema_dohrnii-CCMP3373.AAC.5